MRDCEHPGCGHIANYRASDNVRWLCGYHQHLARLAAELAAEKPSLEAALAEAKTKP